MSQPILNKLKKQKNDLTDAQTDITAYMATPEFIALPPGTRNQVRLHIDSVAGSLRALVLLIAYLESH
jgi:hypothetical protein